MDRKAKQKTSAVSQTEENSNGFYIIAIGASAGGLEALKRFFNNVPVNCPHSFVIIQHLSPDYKSLMAELLTKNTELPIHEVQNNVLVKRSTIYLIPPKKNMTIQNGKLTLEDKPSGHHLNLPIDIFFRSLAEEKGEKAIGIILTGTGSDGTRGVRAIKDAGGMVMVQSPKQAKFDGMPLSAIGTGLVDFILPIEHLPDELFSFINHPTTSEITYKSIERDEETLARILNHIHNITELDFTPYKRPTLARQIERRMGINKSASLKDYLNFIHENPKEAETLSRQFLIQVTKFFRDPEMWKALEEKVLPELVRAKASSRQPLRVWSAGCSTGEEVYSIAILLREEIERQDKYVDVKIFASDIDKNSLDIARKAIYPESIVADVSLERLNKYFICKNSEYQVVETLRKMVVFSPHNILKDPPFNQIDLVICRNLLIYLQSPAQKRAISGLQYALNLNGTLVIGPSETVGEHASVLQEIDRKTKLYRNLQISSRVSFEPLNYPDIQWAQPKSIVRSPRMTDNRLAEMMNEALAEELGLACVYLDENFNILSAVGKIRQFIELPEKGFSINLLHLLPDNVSVAISTAARKAKQQNDTVLYKGVRLSRDGEVFVLNVLVRSSQLNAVNRGPSFMIVFMPQIVEESTTTVIEAKAGEANDQRMVELEQELKDTRENLRLTIEELETTNEELQATNEELLSANEELQSTNEELQSMNEELHTVNAEHRQKIEDMAALNADMDNLLKSTEIGTIFLDGDMSIRRFTPAIQEQFNLRQSDVGRPISHFTSNFVEEDNNDILVNAQKVLSSGRPYDKEMPTQDGKWYLVKITPFRNSDGLVDGVVISFVDINALKRAELSLRASESRFRSVFEQASEGLVVVDASGGIHLTNPSLARMFGYTREELSGKNIEDLIPKSKRAVHKKHQVGFMKNPHTRPMGTNLELFGLRKDGAQFPIEVSLSYFDVEETTYATAMLVDVSERKEAEGKLKAAQRELLKITNRFQISTTAAKVGIWDWDIKTDTLIWDDTMYDLYGITNNDFSEGYDSWMAGIHPEDVERSRQEIEMALKDEKEFDTEFKVVWPDQSIHHIKAVAKVERDAKGTAIRMLGTNWDITPEREAIKREKIRLNLLEIKNKELEQFAYVASHDLQEPLRMVGSYLQLLARRYQGQLDADADKFIAYAVDGANRMKTLINDLLAYSQVGTRGNELTPTSSEAVLEQVLTGLQLAIDENEATLTHDPLPMVMADDTQLGQLFQNLIGNALKFRNEAPPQIHISATQGTRHNGQLTNSLTSSSPYLSSGDWLFSVQDNGIGFDPQFTERIFVIFQRLNLRNEYPGTGIGLAICKKIVERHGGRIWVESQLGQGATFYFTLPGVGDQ